MQGDVQTYSSQSKDLLQNLNQKEHWVDIAVNGFFELFWGFNRSKIVIHNDRKQKSYEQVLENQIPVHGKALDLILCF